MLTAMTLTTSREYESESLHDCVGAEIRHIG